MTQTLIEKLEALIADDAWGYEHPNGDIEKLVSADDLRAIIEQHKHSVPVCSHEPYHGKCIHCGIAFSNGVPSPQPDIVAELVKALDKATELLDPFDHKVQMAKLQAALTRAKEYLK